MTDETNATPGNPDRDDKEKRRGERGSEREKDRQNENTSETASEDSAETPVPEAKRHVLNPKIGIASYTLPDGTKIEAGVPVSLTDEQREAHGDQKYHGLPVLVRA